MSKKKKLNYSQFNKQKKKHKKGTKERWGKQKTNSKIVNFTFYHISNHIKCRLYKTADQRQ